MLRSLHVCFLCKQTSYCKSWRPLAGDIGVPVPLALYSLIQPLIKNSCPLNSVANTDSSSDEAWRMYGDNVLRVRRSVLFPLREDSRPYIYWAKLKYLKALAMGSTIRSKKKHLE